MLDKTETQVKDSYSIVFPDGFLEGIRQNEQNVAKLAETMNGTLDEVKKMWAVEPDEEPKEDPAKLKETMATTVRKAGGQVIPVAIGGFSAIVLTEVTDGVMVKQKPLVRAIVKGVTAIAVWRWGKNIPFMGETGKNVAAALIAFDALRDATPISTWASQVANTISGVIPVGGLGDQKGRNAALNQAENVATNYYRRALGR